MINKEEIKVGDLVKYTDEYGEKFKISKVDRVNKLSFGIEYSYYPVRFDQSQSYFKLSDEEIKKYYDEEFKEFCKNKNKYATKYLDKLMKITKLLEYLKKVENVTFSISIDDILKGINDEIIMINKHYE